MGRQCYRTYHQEEYQKNAQKRNLLHNHEILIRIINIYRPYFLEL